MLCAFPCGSILAHMSKQVSADTKALYDAGVHFGRSKSRRHPTASPFIFVTKQKSDIFNLEQTTEKLNAALEKIAAVAASGKQVLFVGGKTEVQSVVKSAAQSAGAPFVAGRWIGGTLTNFKQIRRRIDRMEKLVQERERGDRSKYTKLERLMLDREIEELEGRFGGLADMRELPGALFVVDGGYESIAVEEARQMNIPVVALSSSDCDLAAVTHPIPGNDSTLKSVRHITQLVADAYQENKRSVTEKPRSAPMSA